MNACLNGKGLSAFVLMVFNCVFLFADVTNFVAACDEGGKIYVADWNVASNQFLDFRLVHTLHDYEGETPYVRAVSVGDFNGDGYDDIVAFRRVYSNCGAVHLLFNDGSNNFSIDRAIEFPAGLSDWMMDSCAGDFNNDGIDDFTFNGNNGMMYFFISDGEGGFNYYFRSDLRLYGRGTDCADMNNDGILDIVRCSYSGGGFSQYLEGNGDGTFKAAVDLAHTGEDPYGSSLGDFDGDGDIDRIENIGSSGDTYFYENIGAVSFAAATSVASLDVNNHGSFDAFDYDSDGNLDVVITDYSARHLYFFHSNGDGTFTNAVLVGTLPSYTMAVSAPPLPSLSTRPSAVSTPMVQSVEVNSNATFNISSSSSPNGVLVSNRWDFGDGEMTPWLPASITATSHVYTVEGHYRPCLYIVDEAGYGDTRTLDVFVDGAEPQVMTDELLFGEADAECGQWPVDIPVTSLVTDAEGISNYCWAVSNIIDFGFEDGLAEGWSAMDGTWAVTNTHAFSGTKCYRQFNASASRTRNLLNTPIEGDFIFEVDCMAVGGTGQEIILNLNGYGWYNTYDIIIRGRGNDDLRIDRITNNGTSIRYNNYLGFVLTNNVPVHAEIHRIGAEITVYINGRWIASTIDGTWTKGRIGLGSYSCDVVFDNVKVHQIGCNKNIQTTLSEGSYDLSLTASDGALQSTNVNINIVCSNDGTAPVANAGGLIFMDESTTTNNVWMASLDGSGSTDAETASDKLTYTWDSGTETFDGGMEVDELWYTSSSVYQTNQIVIPDQGSWGSCYAVTKQTVQRCNGTMFQARIRSTGNSMAGFFHTAGFSYTHMPYAFYFYGGYMYIYEDGSQRNLVCYLNTANYYDVRIVLKADQGAFYYMRQADIGAPWTLIYDSDHSTATDLRRGITLDSGTAYFDDFYTGIYGMTPQMALLGTGDHDIQLTVTDAAGNSATDTVKVFTSGSFPPVANAGVDLTLQEIDAADATWTVDFDGSASTDDYGIMKYEWDWDYSGTFNPSGDEGVTYSHQWTNAGVYSVALRVTDHALQTSVTNITVTIYGGTDPEADSDGPYYLYESDAVAGVWLAALDGSATTDAETSTNDLKYVWSKGLETFDGMDLNSLLWFTSSMAYQTNQIIIPNNGNSWGYNYAVTKHTVQRVPGTMFQARVRSTGNSMAGFFHTAGFSYTHMPYAIYLAGTSLQIYEDGSYRGSFGSLNTAYYYDVRIVLKETQGALFYIRQADIGAEWSLVYDSSYSSASNLRRGITTSTGIAYLDDFVDDVYGVMPQMPLTEEGTIPVTLTVTDLAGNTNVSSTSVIISAGTPPVADHGGPYYYDEFTGDATNGYWNIALDAGATTDNESTNLIYRWSLGNDPLDDERLLDLKWVHDSGTVITNGVLRLGSDANTHYAYTRESFTRVAGLRAEARVRTSVWNSEQGFGFKQDNDSVGWNYFVYALALDNSSGQIAWWENGTWANTGIVYEPDEWYDFRIELKEPSGAYYYYKPAASNDWVLLRETDGQTHTTMRRGFIKWGVATTFEADSYHEWAAGTNANYKLYLHHLGTNDVELTVIDQALNTNTVSTTMVCVANEAPVAGFYPDDLTLNESQAVNGIWEVPFSAALSTDDHSIYKYEWDFDYDAGSGFEPQSTSSTVVHQYVAPGTYVVALRVSDQLLQQHMTTGQVICQIGTPPVAVIPSAYTVEKGWAVEFDGTASIDDSGVVGYEWEFGDGTTGSGARPVHVYTVETNTLLRMRVSDGVGQFSGWVTATVAVVTGTLPTADAGSGYTAAAGGPPVYFDGSGSVDNADPAVIQGVARYNWDVDLATDSDSDGNPSNDVDYVVANPFHTYAVSGVYTSRLTVVDGAGQAATNDTVVTIVDNLAPDVICVPWHGDVSLHHKAVSGEAVTLKAVVRDAGSLTHQWLFGDGSSSSVTTISDKYAVETTHVYSGVPGQHYIATLVVWDASGNEGRDTYLVKIMSDSDATRADIAIDNGLWWLHKNQTKSTGRWNYPYSTYYYASACSSALLAIQMNAHKLLGDPGEDPYVETVRLGFNYLFTMITSDTMSLQNGNNPDTNGNGIGLRPSEGNPGYQLGMVMDAIAASRAHLAVAPSGTAGTVKHRFFLDILTDMVDEYAWGQQDSSTGRGGWRYNMNGGADNSVSQWGAIGLLAAKEMFGINIPQFVIDENKIWLNTSRNGSNYGYDSSNPTWGFYSTTPSAMVQMCMDGIETTNSIWTATEDEMRNVWPIENYSSKLYYAYYAFVKAMRSAKPSPVVQMHLDGFDWYSDPVEGLRVKITGQQDSDGSWYAYAQYNNGYGLQKTMSTAWAIAMLTPTLFSVPPVAEIEAPAQWPYGTNLVLSALGSYHPDSARSITRYSWDLNGDGIYTVITNEPYAVINVRDPGKGDTRITVKLRVTDDNDPAVSSEATATILFGNGPFKPIAVLDQEYAGFAEVYLQLDGSGSWDLDGNTITNYMWDFTNDGTNDFTSTSPLAYWEYTEAGDYSAGLRVVDDGPSGSNTSDWKYVSVSITAPPQFTLPVGVDQETRVWITGGEGVWTGSIVRTHDSVDAGQSPVLEDMQSAWFGTTVTGPGTLSFWWKVSSELNYDWLYFRVNGNVYRGISGEEDWQQVSLDVPEGECVLRWEYFKDKTLSDGRDWGFVDQIVWVPATADEPGFTGWLDQYGLAGSDFNTPCPHDSIPYGFKYCFGLDPLVSNDIVLISLTYDNGRLFVDTPEQDPATLPYVNLSVRAATNLVQGFWTLNLNSTNPPAVPQERTWWTVPDGYPDLFFKLRAEEK